MIEIRPNVLYSRGDLAEMLQPAGVDVDYFIARMKPRKFLRMLWLGEDLLTAMRAAPALTDREEAGGPAAIEMLAPVLACGKGRRGAVGKAARLDDDDPSAALKRYRGELRNVKQ